MARLGATALTRTPSSAASMAAQRVRAMTPGLGRGVVGLARWARQPSTEALLTMTPAPRREHVAQGGPGQRKVPLRVTSSTVDHCSSVMSTIGGLAAEAGVVDQHVDAAELGDGAVDEGLHLGLVGDVAAGCAGDARARSAASPSRRSWWSEMTTGPPPRRSAWRWRSRCRCRPRR